MSNRFFKLASLAPCAIAAVMAAPVAAQTPPPTPPGMVVLPAPSPLSSIPGVAIRYYDVTGNTIPLLRASIAAQRPVNPATGIPSPSSSTWSIGVNVQKSTTGGKCKIAGAKANLKAEVVLPRLTNAEAVPAPVRTEWQRYVSSLEQQQADRLRQPYQRLGEVEQAVMASSCEGASQAANAKIDEITRAAAAPAAVPAAPATPAPVPTP